MNEKIFVTCASLPPFEEYTQEIRHLWNTHWITNTGQKHLQLQENLSSFLGVRNIELLTNGHMSLELTLQAMKLKGEVITTPFTFISTTHAIVRSGLRPVFCDIDPETLTIDTEEIKKLINNQTCAIMPVHVYGNICDVEEIEKIAKENNLKVIYDAAHAFGETYQGKGVGLFGDASCFSFHATKVFNTVEGGAICFKDSSLGERIRELKNFGIHGSEEVNHVGTNAKMNEFCAAMGICNLRHIDEVIDSRKAIVERYRELLETVRGIRLNKTQKDVRANYAYFPIFIDEKRFGVNRDTVMQLLEKEGIYTKKYFYPLTYNTSVYSREYKGTKTPVAKYYSDRVLSLPLSDNMHLSDVDRICAIIKSSSY